MAKPVIKPVLDEEIETVEVDETQDETPDDVAMMSLLDEIKNLPDSSIRIYRVGKHPRDVTLIDEVSPLDYTPVMLKHPPYSGGQFRIYGTHRGQFVFNRIIKVEPAPLVPPETQSSNNDLALVLKAIADQSSQLKEALLIIAAQPKQEVVKESRMDYLRELQVMKELLGSNTPVAPSTDPIKMLKDVMEIQALAGGGGGDSGGSPLMMMGMKLLDKLGELSQNQAQAIQQAAPVALPNPTAREAQRVLPEQPKQEASMSPLDMLIKGAESNGDVDWWADRLYDSLDDDAFQLITEDPQWFEKFSSLDARIPALKPWFVKVRDKLVEIASEPDELTEPAKVEDTIPEPSSVPDNDPKSPPKL